MTDPNQLLWEQAVADEDWELAESYQKIAGGLAQLSLDVAPDSPSEPNTASPPTESPTT